MIGVGIVGYGFMGATHARAYEAARLDGLPCRVVAVCDTLVECLDGAAQGNLDTGSVAGPTDVELVRDLDMLLARDDVDLVSVCTPTDTHVAVAVRALEAGKHVLVEKPVALTVEPIERLAEAARIAARLCMPAMCMRFWPAWAWALDAARGGRYGKVRSAAFQRLGSRPEWSDFYADAARCGGALFDLHVHDADFALAMLGMPELVHTMGNHDRMTTAYAFPGGVRATAEGSWAQSPDDPFVMRFIIEFERASATFELGREPELEVMADGVRIAPELAPGVGYDHEVRALVRAITKGAGEPPVPLADAAAVTRVLLAERESMETWRPIAIG